MVNYPFNLLQLDDLYKEVILDHYKNPSHRGKLVEGIEAGEVNMACGDSLKLYVKLEKGKIADAKFDGGGCAISLAAVDMLLDYVIGRELKEVQKMSGKQVEAMLGVELTLSRKKCAYLGLEVLKKIEE